MSPDAHDLATRVVHAGLDPDPSFGSVIPAIHQTSTFRQPRVGEFVEDFDYARSANPTRAALERALGDLEGGHGTAFSSGMAATHALLTAICSAGDHVVIPGDLYGGTFRLVDKVLTRWGLEYTMVDQTDLDALAAAVLYFALREAHGDGASPGGPPVSTDAFGRQSGPSAPEVPGSAWQAPPAGGAGAP